MNKTFFISLAMAATALTTQAKTLVVKLLDGNEVWYTLSGDESPVMRFAEGTTQISCDTYTLTDVDYFYISNIDAIEGIKQDAPTISGQDKDYLYIRATRPETARLYDVNGRLLDAETATNGNVTAIRTSQLSKGTYIIKMGKNTFKFMKR